MALSTGQVNDAFQKALGRNPTGSEISQYTNDNSYDGSAGQNSLIAQLGGSGGGSDPAQAALDYIQKNANDIASKWTDYQSKMTAYEKANPFSLDDALAKETAASKQIIDPYYNQKLSDYMHGVQIATSRSLEDQNRMITETLADKDAYNGQAKATLDTALLNAGQQYSDAGSYDSGARARSQGVQEANTQYQTDAYNRQSNYNIATQQIAGNRLRNVDLPYQTAIEQRDLNKQENQDVNTMANSEAGVDKNAYYYNMYQNLGASPGQNVTDYQNELANLQTGNSYGATSASVPYNTSIV